MIIAAAFGRLFSNFTIDLTIDGQLRDNVAVNYHYGDQKELVKWIINRQKMADVTKYPLIWYVIAPVKELNGIYHCNSQLIIFQDTKLRWFNDERAVKSFVEIIGPVYREMKSMIDKNSFIHVLGRNQLDKYQFKDEPNFGVNINNVKLNQNDFSSKSKKKEESTSVDFVDARVVNINFKMQPDCIT